MISFKTLPLRTKARVFFLAAKIIVLGFFATGCAYDVTNPIQVQPESVPVCTMQDGTTFACTSPDAWSWVDEIKVPNPANVFWMNCNIRPPRTGYVCKVGGSFGTVTTN